MFDIVICSNRPALMKEQVKRTNAYFPGKNVIVIVPKEGTLHGVFRNTGASYVTSPLFLMLDDDIEYSEYQVNQLLRYHLAMPEILFAVNAHIIFTEQLDLWRVQVSEGPGVAGGFCMYNTAYFRKLGGFRKIGVGEDLDLFNRAVAEGYEWIRADEVHVFHRGSLLDYITRRARHVNPHENLRRRFKVALRNFLKRPMKLWRYGRVVPIMMLYDLFNMLGVLRSLKKRRHYRLINYEWKVLRK